MEPSAIEKAQRDYTVACAQLGQLEYNRTLFEEEVASLTRKRAEKLKEISKLKRKADYLSGQAPSETKPEEEQVNERREDGTEVTKLESQVGDQPDPES